MAAYYSDYQIKNSLQKIGFSENEIKVLNFLFHRKKSTLEKISKFTAISQSSVLFSLTNLEKRGLLKINNQDDTYKICTQKEFLQWIDRQEKKVNEIYDTAQSDIVDFFEVIQEKEWKPTIAYYEGKKAITDLYEDMLKTANETSEKNIYSWIDIAKVHQFVGSEYLEKYIEKRKNMGIMSNDILAKNEYSLAHYTKNEMRNSKFVEDFPINGHIRIYGNKVAVITSDGETPVGFVFQGTLITQLFKTIFDQAWKNIPDQILPADEQGNDHSVRNK